MGNIIVEMVGNTPEQLISHAHKQLSYEKRYMLQYMLQKG